MKNDKDYTIEKFKEFRDSPSFSQATYGLCHLMIDITHWSDLDIYEHWLKHTLPGDRWIVKCAIK